MQVVDKRRQHYLAKLRSAHPTAAQLEKHEFDRVFELSSLERFCTAPERDLHDIDQNYQLIDMSLSFVSFAHWRRYAEAMNTWAQLLQSDPQLFEKYTLEQLLASEHIRPCIVAEHVIDFTPTRKGLFKCTKCNSTNTDYVSVQTRRADEGMTQFIHCYNCNHHFRR